MRSSIFWIVMVGVLISSCSPMNKVNRKFLNGEYDVALSQYKKLLDNPKYAAEANFKIAESYRLSNRVKQSLPYYKASFNQGYDKAMSGFYYAYALKQNGEYDRAREEFNKYLEEIEDTEFYARATKELEILDKIDEIKKKKSYYEVANAGDINTEAAEYSPFTREDRFYFTSTREVGKVYKATGTNFSDIYVTKVNELDIDPRRVTGVGDFINTDGVNEGTLVISPSGKTIIFARGNTGKRKGTDDVNLYISLYRNGRWSEPRLMNINAKNSWTSCPAFSRDGSTLYFASNRRGGYGGTDIYVAHLTRSGRWGNVKNLGPVINTPGNEMFPYVSDDAKLYFSSDGHPGLGGLDLYVAERRRGKITIENLGQPVNTLYDDFGWYMISPNKGFFSSNREGGKGNDDIYTFINNDPNIKVVNYWLDGITKTTNNDGSQSILGNVKMRLLDEDDNQLDFVTTDEEGKFTFRLDPESNYILVGEKPTYFTTRLFFSTEGRSVDPDTLTEFVTDVVFDTVMVLDKIVLDKAIVLENIYYDLDKAYIREDAARELDKLVALLNDNPEIKIELSSHTDSRQTNEYNMDLSQRRAQSAVDYIVAAGIDPSRLSAKGYGETQLIIPDSVIERMATEEEKEAAHQKNRRTEFKVIGFNKKQLEEKTSAEDLEDRLFNEY